MRAENSLSGARAYWVLSINGLDQGATTPEAEFISPNSTTRALIRLPDDIDYFKVILAEKGMFKIRTTGPTDMYCRLYTSANTQIAAHNDNSPTERNCTINRYLTAGTYYIRTEHSPTTLGAGSYRLLTRFVADDGDIRENATPVPGVSTTAAAIDAAGDVDYFTVYLNAAKTVKLNTPGASLYCALQSTDGSLMTDSGNSAEENVACSRTYAVTSAGIYYVKVKHSNAAQAATYNLVVQ